MIGAIVLRSRSCDAGIEVRYYDSKHDGLCLCRFGRRRGDIDPDRSAMEWPDPHHNVASMHYLTRWFVYSAIVMATRDGDVAVIAPFRYARLVFAMLMIFFWGSRTMTFLGQV